MDEPTPRNEQTAGKVYRSEDNKIIAGVCAGLGEYFRLDPVLIRIAWAASAIAGWGIIAYAIAWFAIPEAPGATQERPNKTGTDNPGLWIGVSLLAVGVLILGSRLYPAISVLSIPTVLIVVGLAFLLRGMKRRP